jgi:hypothetical protein
MSEWVALSRTTHAEMHWRPRDGYRFTAYQQIIPVLVAELAKLIPHYALGFIQQGESYQPVALTGLGGEKNLYLNHDGRWLANYVPSILRGYPFSLARVENDQQVLFVERESLLEEGVGEPLFDEQGNLAERLRQTLSFLSQREQNRQATHAACRALADKGLIEPWPLQGRGEGQEPFKVEGLYRIDETALNQLEAGAFSALRVHGALSLAYAQLLSMSQLSQLAERAKYHAKLQSTQSTSGSLNSLFDGGDDELIFDFDN